MLDAPTHHKARDFLAVWRESCQDGDIVIGTDIPSRPFARLLENLMVVEPVEDGRDGLVRVAGTSLRERYGREVSGKRLSTLFSPDVFAQNLARMRAVRETGSPLILTGSVPRQAAPPQRFEAIIIRARAPKTDALWNAVGIFAHQVRGVPD